MRSVDFVLWKEQTSGFIVFVCHSNWLLMPSPVQLGIASQLQQWYSTCMLPRS